MHLYETYLNDHQKYNQMLNDADAYRRAQRLTGKRPYLFKTLFSLFGVVSKAERSEKVVSSASEASTVA